MVIKFVQKNDVQTIKKYQEMDYIFIPVYGNLEDDDKIEICGYIVLDPSKYDKN